MTILSFLLLLVSTVTPQSPAPANVFLPLEVYRGSWRATPSLSGKGSDTIANECHGYAAYFACQQTVNGTVGALVVYVYAGAPGHYSNQAVLPSGKALGKGDLRIEGNRWIFSGSGSDNGKTTWYRTTNIFQGTDHIHFEIAHSSDNKTWVTDHQGDELRLSD